MSSTPSIYQTPTTTPALVAIAPGKPFELQKLLIPEIGPNEALVRISAVGICHADLAVLSGAIPSPFPRVLGHEGAGTIVYVGSDTQKTFKTGTNVLLSFASCGNCAECSNGHPAYCHNQRHLMWSGNATTGFRSLKQDLEVKGGFFGQSSFARFAVVHVSCLVALPQLQPDDMKWIAPFGCAVLTGYGSMTNVLDVQNGMNVVIFGVGTVGLSAIVGALSRKAKLVIAVDVKEERLKLAKEIGATHTIMSDKDPKKTAEAIQQILEETLGDSAGIHCAVDSTGVPAVIEMMIKSLGYRGRAGVIGAPTPGTVAAVDVIDFLLNGKSLVGVVEGDCIPSQIIPELIKEYKSGRLPMQKIVTQYSISQFADAIADMRSGKTIKPVLIWDEE